MNSIGELMKITLRWVRLAVGVSHCPLQQPNKNFDYIDHPWFNTLIKFLYESHASIETNDPPLTRSRQDDSCIMEDFLLLTPSKSELCHLNSCRMFLQVLTLSDIVSVDGKHIRQNCWRGDSTTRNTLLWPRQAKPGSPAWIIWRRYIAECYLEDDSDIRKTRKHLSLQYPLGPWIPQHHDRQIHDYYVSPISQTVYHRLDNHFDVYYPHRNQRTTVTLQFASRSNYLPPGTHPIEPITHQQQTLQLSKRDINNTSPPTHTDPVNFTQHVTNLPHWEQELIKYHSIATDTITAAASLNRPYIIATDGSKENKKGSYGWVMATDTGEIIAKGNGIAYGSDMTSFRSEAYGILAACHFAIQLHRYYHIPLNHTQVVWWCDCNSLLTRLQSAQQSLHNPNRYKLADHDLELALLHSLPLLTTNLDSQHLHSHKFDHTDLTKLPLPQRLNRIADNLAKKRIRMTPQACERVPLLPTTGCQLHIHNKTITRVPALRLRQSYNLHQTSLHIRRRFKLTPASYQDIAWPEFARAFRSLSTASQRIFRRWMYGFIPTQRRLHRQGTCPSPMCPVCKTHVETDEHFISCGGTTPWETSFFQPMALLHRKHDVTHWVETGLVRNFKRYIQNQSPVQMDPWINEAIHSQTEIGWDGCFSGLYSKQWIDKHNQATKSQTGSAFLSKQIQLTMTAIIDRWHNRCNTLHQTSDSSDSEIRRRLLAKVSALYDSIPLLLASDKQLFNLPLEDIRNKSNKYLKNFITQTTPIVRHSIKQQQKLMASQHHDISTYFTRSLPASHSRPTRVTPSH